MELIKMKWARKFFLKTANGIFPGVLEHYKTSCEINSSPDSAQIRRQMAASSVRVRSSLIIQIMLNASALFSLVYFTCLIGTLDLTLSRLKAFHINMLHVVVTVTFVTALRYRLGFSGNMKDDAIGMTTYWMLTLTQLPFLLFILLTHLFAPLILHLAVTMDSIMVLLVIGELFVSLAHTRRLLRDEVRVLKLANESWKVIERLEPETRVQPRIRNSPTTGARLEYMLINESHDGIQETESESGEEFDTPSGSFHEVYFQEPNNSSEAEERFHTINSAELGPFVENDCIPEGRRYSLDSQSEHELVTLFPHVVGNRAASSSRLVTACLNSYQTSSTAQTQSGRSDMTCSDTGPNSQETVSTNCLDVQRVEHQDIDENWSDESQDGLELVARTESRDSFDSEDWPEELEAFNGFRPVAGMLLYNGAEPDWGLGPNGNQRDNDELLPNMGIPPLKNVSLIEFNRRPLGVSTPLWGHDSTWGTDGSDPYEYRKDNDELLPGSWRAAYQTEKCVEYNRKPFCYDWTPPVMGYDPRQIPEEHCSWMDDLDLDLCEELFPDGDALKVEEEVIPKEQKKDESEASVRVQQIRTNAELLWQRLNSDEDQPNYIDERQQEVSEETETDNSEVNKPAVQCPFDQNDLNSSVCSGSEAENENDARLSTDLKNSSWTLVQSVLEDLVNSATDLQGWSEEQASQVVDNKRIVMEELTSSSDSPEETESGSGYFGITYEKKPLKTKVPGATSSSSTTSWEEDGHGSEVSLPFSNLDIIEAEQRRDIVTAQSLPSAGSSDYILVEEQGILSSSASDSAEESEVPLPIQQ